jgi:hypothetical protein
MTDAKQAVFEAEKEAGLREGQNEPDKINTSLMDITHMWCK